MTTYTCRAVRRDGSVCGYKWTPRPGRLELGRKKPVSCPRCQSKFWSGSPTS